MRGFRGDRGERNADAAKVEFLRSEWKNHRRLFRHTCLKVRIYGRKKNFANLNKFKMSRKITN